MFNRAPSEDLILSNFITVSELQYFTAASLKAFLVKLKADQSNMVKGEIAETVSTTVGAEIM